MVRTPILLYFKKTMSPTKRCTQPPSTIVLASTHPNVLLGGYDFILSIICCMVQFHSMYELLLINENHPFVQLWIFSIPDSVTGNGIAVTNVKITTHVNVFHRKGFQVYVEWGHSEYQ